MGLRFRKSINLGPLRINLGKSGVGFSVGVKGFRVGRSAKGKKTATVSLPGTGLSYVQDLDNLDEDLGELKDKLDGNKTTKTSKSSRSSRSTRSTKSGTKKK